jgi:hypothetical protein
MELSADGGYRVDSLARTGNVVLDLLHLAFRGCILQTLSDFNDLRNEARVIQFVCF